VARRTLGEQLGFISPQGSPDKPPSAYPLFMGSARSKERLVQETNGQRDENKKNEKDAKKMRDLR
jgi:hypothetical protein